LYASWPHGKAHPEVWPLAAPLLKGGRKLVPPHSPSPIPQNLGRQTMEKPGLPPSRHAATGQLVVVGKHCKFLPKAGKDEKKRIEIRGRKKKTTVQSGLVLVLL